MRQNISNVQTQVDTDLQAVEEAIRDFLRQAERLYSESKQPISDVKLQVAKACMLGLTEFRSVRNNLLAKRQLFDCISSN